MVWEKKICIRLTVRRILGAILVASTVANLVIVGVVFGAETSPPALTITLSTIAPIPTATYVPVTSTPTETYPLPSSPTLLPTDTPTQQPSDTPTATQTPTNTLVPKATPTTCLPRRDWFVYIIQPGDTLYRIGLLTGASVAELQAANCLYTSWIAAGQPLYVPRLPPTITPTETTVSTYTPTPTGTPPPLPDVVVSRVGTTGPVEVFVRQKSIFVPIYIQIENQGSSEANIFKLSAYYASSSGMGFAPLGMPGASEIGYLYTTSPLAVGQQMTMKATVVLPYTLVGETISISILADSCTGDWNMPASCRVLESNEGNNESYPVSVLLPPDQPPAVTITTPAADQAYDNYAPVVLSGSAEDPEDGILDNASLSWSIGDAAFGTGSRLDLTAYLEKNCGRWVVVRLSATDSHGNIAFVERNVLMVCPIN